MKARRYPDEMPAGSSPMYEADIKDDGETPRLVNRRLILDSRSFPFPCTLEMQNIWKLALDGSGRSERLTNLRNRKAGSRSA